jgi:hypothetical protein
VLPSFGETNYVRSLLKGVQDGVNDVIILEDLLGQSGLSFP